MEQRFSTAKEFYFNAEQQLCTANFGKAYELYLKAIGCLSQKEYLTLGPKVINGLEVLTKIITSQSLQKKKPHEDSEAHKSPLFWCLNKVFKMALLIQHKGRLDLAKQSFAAAGALCSAYLAQKEYHKNQNATLKIPLHKTDCTACHNARKVFIAQAESFIFQSEINTKMRDFKEAVKLAVQGYEIGAHLDLYVLKLKALFGLANAYRFQGQYRKAVSLSSVACDLFASIVNIISDKKKLSAIKALCFHGLINLSAAQEVLGNRSEAVTAANVCFDCMDVTDSKELCQFYMYLGRLYMGSGNTMLKYGCQAFQTLATVCKRFQDYEALAFAYDQLCTLHLALSHQNLTAAFSQYTLVLGRKWENPKITSVAYGLFGRGMEKRKKYPEALDFYWRQLSTASGNNLLEICCHAYLSIGRAFFLLQSFNNAKFFLLHGLERSSGFPHDEMYSRAELLLAQVLEILGDYGEAHFYLRRSILRLEGLAYENIYSVEVNTLNSRRLQKVYKRLVRVLVKLRRFYDALEIVEHVNSREFYRMWQFLHGEPLPSIKKEQIDLLSVKGLVFYFDLCGADLYLWVINRGKGCTKFYKRIFQSPHFVLNNIRKTLLCLEPSKQGSNCCFEAENRAVYSLKCAKRRTLVPSTPVEEDSQGLGAGAREAQITSLRRLFDVLFSSVDHLLRELANGSEVMIIANGTLSLVPFHLLLDECYVPLYRSFNITYIPCLMALKELHSRTPSVESYALVAGNPKIDDVRIRYTTGRLLHTRASEMMEELSLVSAMFGVEALQGEGLTKDFILGQISRADILHLVTLGNTDDGYVIVTPNADRKRDIPETESFVLTVEDFLLVTLRANMVFLSSCQECIHGVRVKMGISRKLITCLLTAGALAVVVCQWAMPFTCYKMLLHQFYCNLDKGHSVGNSIREVCFEMESCYPELHAGHWGALQLFGKDTVVRVSAIKACSIQNRCSSRIESQLNTNKDRHPEEDVLTSQRSKFQRYLADVLCHANAAKMLSLLSDLVQTAMDEKVKFFQTSTKDKRLRKVIFSSDFSKLPSFTKILNFLGFDFLVDKGLPGHTMALLPPWSYDLLLETGYQCIHACSGIAAKSLDVLHSLYRFLLFANKELLDYSLEIIQSATQSDVFMMSDTDQRMFMTWRCQEARQFLQSIGFYIAGDSLLFHRRQSNLEVAGAASRALFGLVELYAKDMQQQKASYGNFRTQDLVSWKQRKLSAREMQHKHQLLTRVKATNNKYESLQSNGREWLKETLHSLHNPHAEIVFVGPRKQQRRGISVTKDGVIKRKVQSGFTPSYNRRSVVEDPLITLTDISAARSEVHKAHRGRHQRMLQKKHQELKVLFYED